MNIFPLRLYLFLVPVSLNAEAFVELDATSKCKHKSDLCYDPDSKLVAIGLSNGYLIRITNMI